MERHVIKVGVVDDHEAIRYGFAAKASLDARVNPVPVVVVRAASTVDSLLAGGERIFDVVALDMSLADGSRPGENVRRLLDAGYPVLVFTMGDRPNDLREALAAGAAGVSRKADDMRDTLELVRRVARGETIDNQDLAAAIHGDTSFGSAGLSDQETRVLSYYAAGFTRRQIALRLNVKENTVGTYLKRTREKYAAVDRPVSNKIDFRRRALEDGINTKDHA